ncbi:hypothetical protein [Cupriavidus taiwanensis]|uniref:hypothetical protein n=1 Tax=Cupriavidus taiwanensis TaxID=164546 RepID=UPI0018DD323A|nr:hypothetical protein [Cupriavidus taiwanensis]
MTWKPITRYAIRCGPWTITKGYVMGDAKYMLWKGETIVGGPYKTAEEAKERAK